MQRALRVIIDAVWAIGAVSGETWATLKIRDLASVAFAAFCRDAGQPENNAIRRHEDATKLDISKTGVLPRRSWLLRS